MVANVLDSWIQSPTQGKTVPDSRGRSPAQCVRSSTQLACKMPKNP